MAERLRDLSLVADHSFSPKQAEILRLLLEGYSSRKIQETLKISANTFSNHFYGINIGADTPTSRGIFGVAEDLTGQRPHNKRELIRILIENDIVVIGS